MINDINQFEENDFYPYDAADEDKNFKEGTDIYLYLINNDYNKENITKWLLFNSTDYNVRKYAFNNLRIRLIEKSNFEISFDKLDTNTI